MKIENTSRLSPGAGNEPPTLEPNSTYQGPFQDSIQPGGSDIFIAVMGMTGVGKSTFISHCTDEVVDVSKPGALKSCTQEVRVHRCRQLEPNATVYLVDTPGFDDTDRKDSDILKEIASWLTKTYQQNIRLRGLLYLHRISDNRMGGCARKNLAMFKKLCGPDGLGNVLFVTTFWEKVEHSVGESREQLLQSTDEFWGFFIQKGSRVHRHWNTGDSALTILTHFAPGSIEVPSGEAKLAIQTEMVDAGKDLDQTSAGQELQSGIQRERQQLMKDIKEREQEMEEARQTRDKEMLDILREEQDNQREQLKRRDREMKELKVSLEMMHEEKVQELEARLREQEEQKKQYQEAMDNMKEQHLAEIAALRDERAAERDQFEDRLDNLNRQIQDMVPISGPSRHNKPEDHSTQNETDTSSGDEAGSAVDAGNLELINDSLLSSARSMVDSHESKTCANHIRVRDGVNLAICGSYHSFLGPVLHFHELPDSLREILNDDHVIRSIALGENETWFYHYHEHEKCYTRFSSNIGSTYLGLPKWIAIFERHGCPIQVTLGTRGYFFIRTTDGSWGYNLPGHIPDRRNIQRLWLGYGKAYVAQYKSGKLSRNLDGHYQPLNNLLKNFDQIEDLALDIHGAELYAVVLSNGDCNWQANGTNSQFPGHVFKEFIRGNCTLREAGLARQFRRLPELDTSDLLETRDNLGSSRSSTAEPETTSQAIRPSRRHGFTLV